MTDFHALIDSYRGCACGQEHECAVRDIAIGSGLVSEVGGLLKKNGFGSRLRGDHAGCRKDRKLF